MPASEKISITLRFRIQQEQVEVIAQPHSGLRQPRPAVRSPFQLVLSPEVQATVDNLRTQPATEAQLTALGNALGVALIPAGAVETAVQEAIAAANKDGGLLRLVLVDLPPALSGLPWEALRYDQRFVALDTNFSLVREVGSVRPFKNARIRGTLRVLFIKGGMPPEFENLGKEIDRTEAEMQDAITALRKANRLRPGRLQIELIAESGDEKSLSNLPAKHYHVIIYAGHGTPDRIFLKSATVGYTPTTATKLMSLLAKQESRLIFLLACETSADNRESNIAAFAPTLTPHFPSVVAMQTQVVYERSSKLAVEFLRGLANGHTVEAALTMARRRPNVNAAISREAISPILYLQTENSALFPAAVNWSLRFLGALALFFLLLALAAIIAQARTQRAAELQVLQDEDKRLQDSGFLAQIRPMRTSAGSTRTLTVSSAGVAQTESRLNQNGYLTLYRGDTQRTHLIEVGRDPGAARFDGRNYWLVNRGADPQTTGQSILMRIPPAENQRPNTFPVGNNAADPILSAGFVYVQSRDDRKVSVLAVDAPEGTAPTEIRTEINAPAIFDGGGAIWLAGRRKLQRIEGNQIVATFNLSGTLRNAIYAADGVWCLFDDGTVQRLNPKDGAILATTTQPFADKATDLIHSNEGVWVLEAGGRQAVRMVISANGITLIPFDLGGTPSYVTFTPGRIWSFFGNEIAVHDAAGALLQKIAFVGADSVREAITDGETIWLNAPAISTVTLLRLVDFSTIRRFTPCQNAHDMALSGGNVWFSCGDRNEPLALPAQIISFRTARARSAAAPIEQAGDLWIPIIESGRILVFDGKAVRTELALPGLQKLLLDPDGRTIWAYSVVGEAGQIVRYRPQLEAASPFNLIDSSPVYRVTADTIPVYGTITNIQIIGDYVWVQHGKTSELKTEPANLTLIQRNSLEIKAQKIELLTTSVTAIDQDVWVGAVNDSDGILARLDKTGTLKATYNPSDTRNSTFGVASWGKKIWMLSGAIPFAAVTEILNNGLNLANRDIPSVPILFTLDPATGQFEPKFSFRALPLRPVIDGARLWFLTTSLPQLIPSPNAPGSWQLVMFQMDSAQSKTYDVCAYPNLLGIGGDFMWAGCNVDTPVLVAINRENPDQVLRFEQTGITPSAPLVVGDRVWFTFQDSASAAVFNAKTGQLLGMQATASRPGAPFSYQGGIWTYAAGDSVLQRLDTASSR